MSRQVKVGIFVLAGLVLTMIAVFLIGNTRQLWEPKVAYRTAFKDVAGLKPGAPVRMGGLDIGQVTAVAHAHDAKDSRIYVSMSVDRPEAARIRSDSVARVVNKGLLGDKMIELGVGSPDAPPVDAKALLRSEEPLDMFAAANRVAAAAQATIEKLDPLVQSLGDPQLSADIKGSAADLHALLDAMVKGDGTMHRIFYDHRAADAVEQLLANPNPTPEHLHATLAPVPHRT